MSRPQLSDLGPTGSPGRRVWARAGAQDSGMLRSSQAQAAPGPGFHAPGAATRTRTGRAARAHYKPVLENWVQERSSERGPAKTWKTEILLEIMVDYILELVTASTLGVLG